MLGPNAKIVAAQMAERLYEVFLNRMIYTGFELEDYDTRWKHLRESELELLQDIRNALPSESLDRAIAFFEHERDNP